HNTRTLWMGLGGSELPVGILMRAHPPERPHQVATPSISLPIASRFTIDSHEGSRRSEQPDAVAKRRLCVVTLHDLPFHLRPRFCNPTEGARLRAEAEGLRNQPSPAIKSAWPVLVCGPGPALFTSNLQGKTHNQAPSVILLLVPDSISPKLANLVL